MYDALIIANATIASLAFLYLYVRERSRASLYWAASFLALLLGAALVSEPARSMGLEPYIYAAVGSCTLLILLGALAHAERRIPRGLVGGVLALELGVLLLALLGERSTVLVLSLFVELPLLGAAAVVLWRHADSPLAGLPERLLGGALLILAGIDGVETSIRMGGGEAIQLAPLWLSVMLLIGLLQIMALLDRSRSREHALSEDLGRARRLDALGRMLSGVAHDFNNQLTVITGNASLIRECLRNGDEDALQSLDELELSARHCSDLTRDLLTFAREGHGEVRAVPMAALLRDVEGWLRSSLPAGVELEVEILGQPRPALADRAQLQRVIGNLLLNARDAVGACGLIRVQVSERIDAPAPSAGNGKQAGLFGPGPSRPPAGTAGWLEIAVSDDGSGMDAETRRHLFDPFFSTKGPDGGSGLGLAIVYGVVRDHGGSIDVASEPGRGTTFRITWPCARAEAQQQGSSPLPPAIPARPLEAATLLVADDEDATRRALCAHLKQQGYRVLEARDGNEAIDLFSSHRGEVALGVVDFAMPGRNGLEAIRAMRELAPTLPVILVSGSAGLDTDALPAESIALMSKPFRPAELLGCVRSLLAVETG